MESSFIPERFLSRKGKKGKKGKKRKK